MTQQPQYELVEPAATPRDTDAVIAALARPAIAVLSQAASRLQPLTPAALAALQGAAQMQLAEIVTTLRSRHDGLAERAAAERAVAALIDLPQAMRISVQRQRGTGVQGEAV